MVADAKVTIIHNGNWLRDIYAAADGWYGAVDLPPGNYTVIITDADGRQNVINTVITPGVVTNI
jgi:hypothetical protein